MSAPDGMNEKSVVWGTELRLDSLIAGLTKSMPASIPTLLVAGVTMPIADVATKAREVEKPWKDSRSAQATIRAVMQSRPRDEELALAFLNDVKVALAAALGRESEKLTDFGFRPQKRRPQMTAEQKILRAAKAKMTRALRHTMGARQKAELKATETPTVHIGPNGVEVEKPSEKAAPAPIAPATPGGTSSSPDTSARAV